LRTPRVWFSNRRKTATLTTPPFFCRPTPFHPRQQHHTAAPLDNFGVPQCMIHHPANGKEWAPVTVPRRTKSKEPSRRTICSRHHRVNRKCVSAARSDRQSFMRKKITRGKKVLTLLLFFLGRITPSIPPSSVLNCICVPRKV